MLSRNTLQWISNFVPFPHPYSGLLLVLHDVQPHYCKGDLGLHWESSGKDFSPVSQCYTLPNVRITRLFFLIHYEKRALVLDSSVQIFLEKHHDWIPAMPPCCSDHFVPMGRATHPLTHRIACTHYGCSCHQSLYLWTIERTCSVRRNIREYICLVIFQDIITWKSAVAIRPTLFVWREEML